MPSFKEKICLRSQPSSDSFHRGGDVFKVPFLVRVFTTCLKTFQQISVKCGGEFRQKPRDD